MTEIIVRGRQGGKTTVLIRIAAETGCYIVCADHRRAWQVARQAEDLGLRVPFPLSVSEWRKGEYHPPGVPGLLFDDLDKIVGMLSSVPVVAATWTGEAGCVPNPGSAP